MLVASNKKGEESEKGAKDSEKGTKREPLARRLRRRKRVKHVGIKYQRSEEVLRRAREHARLLVPRGFGCDRIDGGAAALAPILGPRQRSALHAPRHAVAARALESRLLYQKANNTNDVCRVISC